VAQTLRYATEVLASFPDNTSGLIDAVHNRDFAISYIRGGAFLETTTDVTIPIVSGTPVSVNPLLVGVTTVGNLWSFDGNNFAFPNYTATLTDTVIPAGYTKLVRFLAVLGITKSGGGTDNYEIQWTKNGVLFGIAHDVLYTGAGTRTVTIPEVTSQEVAISDVYGVSITGIGTGADVVVESMTIQVNDAILNAAP